MNSLQVLRYKKEYLTYNEHLCGNVFVFVPDSEWSFILGES